MKKKIILSIFIFLGIVCITGCSFGGEKNSSGSLTGANKNIKGNCNAIECIKKIKPENTVEEINSIIGFDGKLTDEKYNKYYWKLAEETGVEVTYYSAKTGTIRIDFDRDSLANSKVDFSRYDELQPKIKEGISYNDFISYIGNVEGTIIEKSSISTKYVWVSSDGSYLNGSFSNSSEKCIFVSARIK